MQWLRVPSSVHPAVAVEADTFGIRLDRLVGNGNDREGSVHNASWFFRLVLELVLDSALSGVSTDTIKTTLRKKYSEKDERIKYVYRNIPGDDYWGMMTNDLLAVLESRNILYKEEDTDRWQLGSDFAVNESLLIVSPRNKKNGEISVTITSKSDREASDLTDRRKSLIHMFANHLKPSQEGLRMNRKRVLELIELMTEFCDRRGNPQYCDAFAPLVDQHGLLLDGRLRSLAAKEIGIPVPSPIEKWVRSDAEALMVAISANRFYYTEKELKSLAKELLCEGDDIASILRHLRTYEELDTFVRAPEVLQVPSSNLVPVVITPSVPSVAVVQADSPMVVPPPAIFVPEVVINSKGKVVGANTAKVRQVCTNKRHATSLTFADREIMLILFLKIKNRAMGANEISRELNKLLRAVGTERFGKLGWKFAKGEDEDKVVKNHAVTRATYEPEVHGIITVSGKPLEYKFTDEAGTFKMEPDVIKLMVELEKLLQKS